MQHWRSSEPAISSASQGNTGTSWNQKIHHRVQNSQPSQVNHGHTLRCYFWQLNFIIILPSAPRSYKWSPTFRFPTQNALCISLLVCATRFTPLIFLHFINTNNIWSGAKIIKIIKKQIFPSPCHFLRVLSKYFPHRHILEYLQSSFDRQTTRPSFTPICELLFNNSYLIKTSSDKMFKKLFADKKQTWCTKIKTLKL